MGKVCKSKNKGKHCKKPQKRKLFQYEEKDLTRSLFAIQNEGMKVKTASDKFAVPRTTLRDKLKAGNAPIIFGKVGPECILGKEVEQELVNWVKQCAKSGFPIDKDGLTYSVKLILNKSKMNTPFKKKYPWR